MMTCPKCTGATVLDHHYDALVCFVCDIFVEDKCPDSHCLYCPDRPDKPSQNQDRKDPQPLE